MRKSLIILTFTIFTICSVFCDQSVQTNSVTKKSNDVQQSADSTKTKRGIHGYAGLRYLPPALPQYSGINYVRHTPYSSFPGRIYTGPGGPSYALTPGNAVVHSYNANYPRIILPRPVLRPAFPAPLPPPPPPVFIHSKPIVPSVPVYTRRYPVFVQKPFVVPKPIVPLPPPPPPVTQFAVPNFVSPIPPHIHTTHSVPLPLQGSAVLPPSTFIPQNEWKPIYSSFPSISSPSPASTVPFFPSHHSHFDLASHSHPQRPSNYYLPADPSPVHDGNAHSTHDELSHENGMQIFRTFFIKYMEPVTML